MVFGIVLENFQSSSFVSLFENNRLVGKGRNGPKWANLGKTQSSARMLNVLAIWTQSLGFAVSNILPNLNTLPNSNSIRLNRWRGGNVNLGVFTFRVIMRRYMFYNSKMCFDVFHLFRPLVLFIFTFPGKTIYTTPNPIFLSLRSYRVESTASRPLCEVKLHWAGLVLRWVTTGELSGVVSNFLTFCSVMVRVAQRAQLLELRGVYLGQIKVSESTFLIQRGVIEYGSNEYDVDFGTCLGGIWTFWRFCETSTFKGIYWPVPQLG